MTFEDRLDPAAIMILGVPGVEGFAIGDRVAYPMDPGAYAEVRNAPARVLVKLPDTIDDRTAAASMLKGLTAWYLLRRSYAVKPGDPILLYAAAGGVGLAAVQIGVALGARVIGTRKEPDQRKDFTEPMPDGLDRILEHDQLPELLAESDFVVLAVPLTPDTDKLMNGPRLA